MLEEQAAQKRAGILRRSGWAWTSAGMTTIGHVFLWHAALKCNNHTTCTPPCRGKTSSPEQATQRETYMCQGGRALPDMRCMRIQIDEMHAYPTPLDDCTLPQLGVA